MYLFVSELALCGIPERKLCPCVRNVVIIHPLVLELGLLWTGIGHGHPPQGSTWREVPANHIPQLVNIRNMMEGNFDFSQFQVHVHTLASSPDSLSSQYTPKGGEPGDKAMHM